MDGAQEERNLVNALQATGWTAIRLAASGGGTTADLPDVLAARNGVIVAIELKSGGPPSNVGSDEVDALQRFSDAFRAGAVVAIRYKNDRTFYMSAPEDFDRTDSGNLSVPNDASRLPWDLALGFNPDTTPIEVDEHINPPKRMDMSTWDLQSWTDEVRSRQVQRGSLFDGEPGRSGGADSA